MIANCARQTYWSQIFLFYFKESLVAGFLYLFRENFDQIWDSVLCAGVHILDFADIVFLWQDQAENARWSACWFWLFTKANIHYDTQEA